MVISIYKKLPFLKKDQKKAPSTRSFQNQNRTIILPFKKAVVYILSTKKMILGNGAKWNLKKGYKYNILKK